MKILLVNKFFYRRGGAEAVFFTTADLLRRAGNTVIAFSMRHPENERSADEDFFVRCVDFPTLTGTFRLLSQAVRTIYSREARRKITLLIRRERPDIAHLHNYYFHLTPSILYALRAAGVPVVHTLHDYHLVCPNHAFYDYRRDAVCEDCPTHGLRSVLVNGCMRVGRLRSLVAYLEARVYRWLRTYSRLVDHYIAPSEFLRAKVTPHPVPADRITVLANPVEDYGDLGPPPENGPLVYAGRLSREKGLDLILEVARRLPRTRWRLAGTGPLEDELRSAIGRREITNVELLGRLEGAALREEYRRAAAVVLPSRCYENCPLTVLEAMSAGRPTIGSRIGGIAELVRDGETGWLFEPGSADDFERAARRALAKPAAAQAGQIARHTFRERYAAKGHLETLERIYERATAELGSRTPIRMP